MSEYGGEFIGTLYICGEFFWARSEAQQNIWLFVSMCSMEVNALNVWQAVKFLSVTKPLAILTTLNFDVSYQGVYGETIYLEGLGETRNAYTILVRNNAGKKHLEDVGVIDKITLILLLKLRNGDRWIHTVKYLPVVDSI